MKRTYKQLNGWERDIIANFLAMGLSPKQIGLLLDRHKSTINREIKRNKSSYSYDGIQYLSHLANSQASFRKENANKHIRLKSRDIQAYAIRKLRIGWSPEIIAAKIKGDKSGCKINYESIYQYIYFRKEAGEINLIKYLVRKHRKRYKKRVGRKPKRVNIPNRVLITKRPKYIEKRKQLGHWESDTAVSRLSKVAINAVVERRTRFVHLEKLDRKKSEDVKNALLKDLLQYPENLRKTITYDNGLENVKHEQVNKTLGTRSYFCNPYHSWEKGSIENVIGIFRRYLPKGTDFAKISAEEIKRIEDTINDRPKKCLGFKSPREMLALLSSKST